MQQHDEASLALHQGPNSVLVVLAEDEVAFPVARHGSVLDFRGSLGNLHPVQDTAAQFGTGPRAAVGPLKAQLLREFFAKHSTALDVQSLVDGLVRYLHCSVVRMLFT